MLKIDVNSVAETLFLCDNDTLSEIQKIIYKDFSYMANNMNIENFTYLFPSANKLYNIVDKNYEKEIDNKNKEDIEF